MCPLRLTGELEASRGELICTDAMSGYCVQEAARPGSGWDSRAARSCSASCWPRENGRVRVPARHGITSEAESIGLLLTESRIKGEIKIKRDENPRNSRSCLYWF